MKRGITLEKGIAFDRVGFFAITNVCVANISILLIAKFCSD